MVDYFYETLVDVESAPGEIKPKLAERWQVSRDGLSITFQFRRGVTFHDGTPMNAAAVKATIERLLDPKIRNPNRYLFTPIKSVETSGDLSVRLTLSQPSPFVLSGLGTTTGAMLSPAAVQARGRPVLGGSGRRRHGSVHLQRVAAR